MFDQHTIDRFKELPTPFYYYNPKLLSDTLGRLAKVSEKYDYAMHYAIKANANPEILRMIAGHGFGADCVSGNEIKTALECGFGSDSIAFAGVGKSDAEILYGLEKNIFSFNCESWPEIEVIDQLAVKTGKKARVALRVNPNLNPHTHHFITTGLEENKFGIQLWELGDILERAVKLSGIELIGLHFHLGSQICDLAVFKSLCIKVNEIQEKFARYHTFFSHLNLGGGLGIDYRNPDLHPIPDFESYLGIFKDFLHPLPGQSVHFEPGRAIVGQCGSLISKVLYVKKGVKTDFVILDAGMTELIRPALYQAVHRIENLTAHNNSKRKRYDVVGPICESSDTFGKRIELPATQRGDLLAIRSTGAYGEVMSSGYNLRDKARAYYF